MDFRAAKETIHYILHTLYIFGKSNMDTKTVDITSRRSSIQNLK